MTDRLAISSVGGARQRREHRPGDEHEQTAGEGPAAAEAVAEAARR